MKEIGFHVLIFVVFYFVFDRSNDCDSFTTVKCFTQKSTCNVDAKGLPGKTPPPLVKYSGFPKRKSKLEKLAFHVFALKKHSYYAREERQAAFDNRASCKQKFYISAF